MSYSNGLSCSGLMQRLLFSSWTVLILLPDREQSPKSFHEALTPLVDCHFALQGTQYTRLPCYYHIYPNLFLASSHNFQGSFKHLESVGASVCPPCRAWFLWSEKPGSAKLGGCFREGFVQASSIKRSLATGWWARKSSVPAFPAPTVLPASPCTLRFKAQAGSRCGSLLFH